MSKSVGLHSGGECRKNTGRDSTGGTEVYELVEELARYLPKKIQAIFI